MLIPKPDAVQQEKNLLLLMILDILSEDTSAEQRITKEELRKRIEERFGFSPARNTLYDKLRMLEIAGFGIVAGDDGIYLETDHMTDGALRYLVDSVLYSDFVTHTGAKDIIDMLKSLGSPAFRKTRIISLAAPAVIVAIWCLIAVAKGLNKTTIPLGVETLFIAQASYFHLKHLIIKDVEYGLIKAIRSYNLFALIYALLCMLEMLIESFNLPEIFIAVVYVLQCVVLLVFVPVLERGVKKWTT